MARLIDADKFVIEELYERDGLYYCDTFVSGVRRVMRAICDAPTVDAVPREAYDDLRDMFVDYVCSGTTNPAPYCANSCPECTDARGWCSNGCKGFSPKTDGGNERG